MCKRLMKITLSFLLLTIIISVVVAENVEIFRVEDGHNHRHAYVEVRSLTKVYRPSNSNLIFYRDNDNSFDFYILKWDNCGDMDYYRVDATVRGLTLPATAAAPLNLAFGTNCNYSSGSWTYKNGYVTYTEPRLVSYPYLHVEYVTVNANVGENFSVSCAIYHRGCFIVCSTDSSPQATSYVQFKKDMMPPYFKKIDSSGNLIGFSPKISGSKDIKVSEVVWFNGEVRLELEPDDYENGSGVNHIKWTKNTIPMTDIMISRDTIWRTEYIGEGVGEGGIYTITLNPVDNVGNKPDIPLQTVVLGIDKAQPAPVTVFNLEFGTVINPLTEVVLSWEPVVDYCAENIMGGVGVGRYEIAIKESTNNADFSPSSDDSVSESGPDGRWSKTLPIGTRLLRGKTYDFAIRAVDKLDNNINSTDNWTIIPNVTIPPAINIEAIDTTSMLPYMETDGQSLPQVVYPYTILLDIDMAQLATVRGIRLSYKPTVAGDDVPLIENTVDQIIGPDGEPVAPWKRVGTKLGIDLSFRGDKIHAHKSYPFCVTTLHKENFGNLEERSIFDKMAPFANIPADFQVLIEQAQMDGTFVLLATLDKQGYFPENTNAAAIINTSDDVYIRVLSLNNDGTVNPEGVDSEGDPLAFRLWTINGAPIHGPLWVGSGQRTRLGSDDCPLNGDDIFVYQCFVDVCEFTQANGVLVPLTDIYNDPAAGESGNRYETLKTVHQADNRQEGFYIAFDLTAARGAFALKSADGLRDLNMSSPTNTKDVGIAIEPGDITDVTGVVASGISQVQIWNFEMSRITSPADLNPYDIGHFDTSDESARTLLSLLATNEGSMPAERYFEPWQLIPPSVQSAEDYKDEYRSVVMKITDNAIPPNVYYTIRTVLLDTSPIDPPAYASFDHSHHADSLTIYWENLEGLDYKASYTLGTDAPIPETACPNATLTIPLAADDFNKPVQVNVRAIDIAGNTSLPQLYTVYTQAKLGNVSVTSKGTDPATGNRYIVFSLTADASQASDHFLELLDNGLVTDTFRFESNQYIHSGLEAKKSYVYRLVALNNDATEYDRVVGEPFVVTTSNTPPAPPILNQPTGFASATTYFSWYPAVDPEGDGLQYHFYLLQGNETIHSGSTSGAHYPENSPLPEGLLTEGNTYSWYVEADDYPYNPLQDSFRSASVTFSFIVDNTPPVITSDYAAGTVFTNRQEINCSIEESLSGLNQVVYWTSDGVVPQTNPQVMAITDRGNGLYTGTVNLHASTGTYTVFVRAWDNAHNEAVYRLEKLGVDHTSPQIQNINIHTPQDMTGTYLIPSRRVNISVTASDDYSGLASLAYGFSSLPGLEPAVWAAVNLDELPDYEGNGVSKTYTRQINLDREDGQTTYLSLKVQDWAGNESLLFSTDNGLFIDTSAPAAHLSLNGLVYSGGEYFTAHPENLQVDFSGEDPHSSIQTEIGISEAESTPMQWFSNWSAAVQQDFNPGVEYKIFTRVTNRTGLNAWQESPVFMYDNTSPGALQIFIEPQTEVMPGETLRIRVSAEALFAPVVSYALTIGTTPDSSNFSSLVNGNENGRLVAQGPGEALYIVTVPSTADGTYYLGLTAYNAVGTSAAYEGEVKSLTVNSNAARVLVWDRGPYSSSATTFAGRWEYRGTQTVLEYNYRLANSEGPVTAWAKTNLQQLTIENLQLEDNKTYWLEVEAVYTDYNVSAAGRSLGVTIDTSAPVFASGSGLFTPAATTSGKLWFAYQVNDAESGLKSIEVLVQAYNAQNELAAISGGWLKLVNKTEADSVLLNTTVDGRPLNFVSGQPVYISLRVTNKAGLTIERTGSAVMIDDTPPPEPVVNDYTDALHPSQYPEANWIFSPSDDQSGIKNYYWALVNDPHDLSNIEWHLGDETKTCLVASVLGDSFPCVHGQTWYFAVKAVNGAGLETTGFSNGFTYDETAPLLAATKLVRVSTLTEAAGAAELHFLQTTDNLKIYIDANEEESAITSYSARTGYWDSELYWKAASGEPYTATENLIPLENPVPLFSSEQITAFRSQCFNTAGLVSEIGYTKGAMLDAGEIVVANVHGQAAGEELYFDWQASAQVPITHYLVALTYENEPAPALWQNTGSATNITFQATALNLADGRYSLKVKAVSASGRESAVAISPPVILDRTAPEITRYDTPPYASSGIKLYLEARDTESGIAEYQYALGTFEDSTLFTKGFISVLSPAGVLDQTLLFDNLDAGLAGVQDGSALYLSVRVRNRSGYFSPVWLSAPIVIDKTPASTPIVTAPAFSTLPDKITAINFDSLDPHSKITHYRLAAVTGTEPAALVNATWQEMAVTPSAVEALVLTDYILENLSLAHNVRYYVAVQTRNGAGDWSEVGFSQSLLNDQLPPHMAFTTGSQEVVLNDLPSGFQYVLTEDTGTTVEVKFTITWLATGVSEELPILLLTEGTYQLPFARTDYGRYTIDVSLRDESGHSVELKGVQRLRVNAPPVITMTDFATTPGRPLTLRADNITDPDGAEDEPLTCNWDIFNDGTLLLAAANPAYAYYHVDPLTGFTRYEVKLTVTDKNGKSASKSVFVNVRNTEEGPLYADEFWSGQHWMRGDIEVPAGRALTFLPGTVVNVTGSPLSGYNHRLTIKGSLDARSGGTVRMEEGNPNYWNGLYIDSNGSALLNGLQIQDARRGLTLVQSSSLDMTGCWFSENLIGVHVLDTSPLITSCTFINNTQYAIKEDKGANPVVTGCLFTGNLFDYYDELATVIDARRLNEITGNANNTTDKEME